MKEGFQFHFNIKRPCWQSSYNSIKGIILFRFSWHDETYENNHFLEQRKKIMTTTSLASTSNNTTKVKRLREKGFYVFCFFCFGFVLWWVLFLCFCQAYKFFCHKKSSNYLQIKQQQRVFITKRETLPQSWFLSQSWKNSKGIF